MVGKHSIPIYLNLFALKQPKLWTLGHSECKRVKYANCIGLLKDYLTRKLLTLALTRLHICAQAISDVQFIPIYALTWALTKYGSYMFISAAVFPPSCQFILWFNLR